MVKVTMTNTVQMNSTVPSNTPLLGNLDSIGPGWGRFHL